jgi:hypothetical protein
MVKAAEPPVPDKGMVWGLPAALSVMVRVPLSVPVPLGVNVTEIWQLPPAPTLTPQLLVSPKSPVAEMLLIVSAAPPGLVNVTTCGELVVPTGCEGKVSLLGLELTSAPAKAVPESWTFGGFQAGRQ